MVHLTQYSESHHNQQDDVYHFEVTALKGYKFHPSSHISAENTAGDVEQST
jgi:hypothetical protein